MPVHDHCTKIGFILKLPLGSETPSYVTVFIAIMQPTCTWTLHVKERLQVLPTAANPKERHCALTTAIPQTLVFLSQAYRVEAPQDNKISHFDAGLFPALEKKVKNQT